MSYLRAYHFLNMSSISYLRFLGLNVLLFLSDATYAAICSTSKGGSWSDIGNPHDIMRALSGLCNDYGVTNKNYSLYDGVSVVEVLMM